MVYQKHICLLVTEDDKDIIGFDDSVGASIKERFKSVCGDALRFSTYEVVRGQFPTVIDEFDGYLVTGSHYNVEQRLPWMLDLEDFICQASEFPHIKIFGICFGHQIIANAFGGKVGKNPCGNYLFSCGKVDVTHEFKEKHFFKSIFPDRDNFYIVQSHMQQVLVKPKTSRTVGSSPECHNEVLMYGENVLSMQGHPEVSVHRMENLTVPMIKSKGLITDEEERKVRKQLINDNGDELVTLVTKFFQS